MNLILVQTQIEGNISQTPHAWRGTCNTSSIWLQWCIQRPLDNAQLLRTADKALATRQTDSQLFQVLNRSCHPKSLKNLTSTADKITHSSMANFKWPFTTNIIEMHKVWLKWCQHQLLQMSWCVCSSQSIQLTRILLKNDIHNLSKTINLHGF